MLGSRLRHERWSAEGFALLLLWAGAAGAVEGPVIPGAIDGGVPRVEASLVADVDRAAPGVPFTLGVRFQMPEGWHIYWKHPGETGLSTEVAFEVPGLQVGSLRWPFPETFRSPDGFITSYGYGGEVILFSEATLTPGAAADSVPLQATANVLVCEVDCIPADLELTLAIPVGAEAVPDAALRERLESFAPRVPLSLERAGLAVRFEPADAADAGLLRGSVLLTRTSGSAPLEVTKDFFAPERFEGFTGVKLTPEGEGRFTFEGRLSPDGLPQSPEVVGALRLGSGADAQFVELVFAIAGGTADGEDTAAAATASGRSPGAQETEGGIGWGWALLLSFLGGALLNLMPCVFPVLALKAYGFTRMVQEGQGRVGGHAVAYTAGILASMLVLALAVIGIRAAGHGVGWGFQFQEPLFVAAVSGLLIAFCLNLFGVFDVSLGGEARLAELVDARQGRWKSAGEGVLAVVLATPCSAPMLGTAVGFALASGPAMTLASFLALGLGLAAPFCLLVMIPGLARRLPKPGAWMQHFKTVLGFALLGTTLWLVWVMGGLVGVDGMGRLLAFLLVIALAAWLFGLFQYANARRTRILAALGAVLVIGLSGMQLLRFEVPEAGADPALSTSLKDGKRVWSEEAVQAVLAEGRPAFVDLTADWCLTCKFNERTVLASDDVREAFERHDVAFFVGDFTRRDPAIAALLAKHQKAGVPLYLLYDPARPGTPEVLPEALTPSIIRGALERLTPSSG